jgi:hypothetical protein
MDDAFIPFPQWPIRKKQREIKADHFRGLRDSQNASPSSQLEIRGRDEQASWQAIFNWRLTLHEKKVRR